MAKNTRLKYPLCVEWKTELPFNSSPRKSTNLSLWGSEWFLELRCGYSMGDFELTLHNAYSSNSILDASSSVTTSLGCGISYETPLIIDRRNFKKSGNYLWQKTGEEVLSKIPHIFVTGKMKIFCIFHSIEIDVEKALIVRQVDSASPIRYNVTSSLQSLSKDFSTFLKDVTFSDVKLICADRTFSAHRLVLAARSEVFAAMFRNEMSEKETGMVDVKEVDPEVFELVLQYMYSGRRPELRDDTACRLYEAADRYAVHGLKEACADWMLEQYTPEKFLKLLVLADQHSDGDFKEVVACYVAKKLTSLSAVSWSRFKEKYPQLAFLVLEKRLAAP